MSSDRKKTIIEDGTDFDGSVTSSCEITLSGTLKGELLAPTLTVTSSGSMHGNAKVEQLVSEGEIAGEIDAQNVVLGGKVNDDTVISAETLEVKLSQPKDGIRVTFGDCKLRVGDTQRKRTDTSKEAKEKEPALTTKSTF